MGIKITIAVCDDDDKVHDIIKNYCSNYFVDDEIGYVDFYDGDEVIAYCKEINKRIDLLFLDIEMEKLSGLDVLNSIINNSSIWRIAFVSSHVESVLDTFSIKTIGFIPKPIEKDRINKILKSVVEEYEENKTLKVTVGNRTELIGLEEIVYLKADGSYTEVYVKKIDELKTFTIAKKLGVIEKLLDEKIFLRVHKSYIVNAEYVYKNRADIFLKGVTDCIPIGRKYKESFTCSMKNYKSMRIGRRL